MYNEVIDSTLKKFPTLYDYQEEGTRCAINRTIATLDPLLLVLPTAAGKSFILAAMAAVLEEMANKSSESEKKVLVLAPSQELVEQNCEKMRSHGFDASIYCAGLNEKDLSSNIVFGSSQSVASGIAAFKDHSFSAVFLDEAHSHPPTVIKIIAELRTVNPNIRVLGTTATPYRLGRGFIYETHSYYKRPPLSEELARDPFFKEVVFEISAHELIEMGRIVPPIIGDISDHYDTQGLKKTQTGNWDKKSEDKVFLDGQSDLTKQIIDDIVRKTKHRNGVMIFAQNVEHANLVAGLLPADKTELITADTTTAQRKATLRRFKAGDLKYLVNVSALTTGFDAPIVDTIAMLRTTESASLFQQIIGRGVRLCPEIGKRDCVILDYAQNVDRFAPDGDLFSPEITATKPNGKEVELQEVLCPTCSNVNHFRPVTPPDGTFMNDEGFLQLTGFNEPLLTEDRHLVAGHQGTRCTHYIEAEDGSKSRCTQTWSRKVCPRCHVMNAQNAMFCKSCFAPVTSSAESFQYRAAIEPEALYAIRFAEIHKMSWIPTKSRKGQTMLKLSFEVQEPPHVLFDEEGNAQMKTSERQDITVWTSPEIQHPRAKEGWKTIIEGCGSRPTQNIDDVIEGKVLLQAPPYLRFQLKPPQQGQSEPRFFEVIQFLEEHPHKAEEDTAA